MSNNKDKHPQLTKESKDIIAVEIVSRFSQMQGRNGSISKIRKETFIDGVLWALTYSKLLKAQGLFTTEEIKSMKAERENETFLSVDKLLNSIICADPQVISDFHSSDLIIRDLYTQCKKIKKLVNTIPPKK